MSVKAPTINMSDFLNSMSLGSSTTLGSYPSFTTPALSMPSFSGFSMPYDYSSSITPLLSNFSTPYDFSSFGMPSYSTTLAEQKEAKAKQEADEKAEKEKQKQEIYAAMSKNITKIESIDDKYKKEIPKKLQEKPSTEKLDIGGAVFNIFKGAGRVLTDLVTDEKGNFNIGKAVVTVGTAIAVTAAVGFLDGITFGLATPALIGIGVCLGGQKLLKGIDGVSKAKTREEEEAAYQDIGGGGLIAVTSLAGGIFKFMKGRATTAAKAESSVRALETLETRFEGSKVVPKVMEALSDPKKQKWSSTLNNAAKDMEPLLETLRKQGLNTEEKAALETLNSNLTKKGFIKFPNSLGKLDKKGLIDNLKALKEGLAGKEKEDANALINSLENASDDNKFLSIIKRAKDLFKDTKDMKAAEIRAQLNQAASEADSFGTFVRSKLDTPINEHVLNTLKDTGETFLRHPGGIPLATAAIGWENSTTARELYEAGLNEEVTNMAKEKNKVAEDMVKEVQELAKLNNISTTNKGVGDLLIELLKADDENAKEFASKVLITMFGIDTTDKNADEIQEELVELETGAEAA